MGRRSARAGPSPTRPRSHAGRRRCAPDDPCEGACPVGDRPGRRPHTGHFGERGVGRRGETLPVPARRYGEQRADVGGAADQRRARPATGGPARAGAGRHRARVRPRRARRCELQPLVGEELAAGETAGATISVARSPAPSASVGAPRDEKRAPACGISGSGMYSTYAPGAEFALADARSPAAIRYALVAAWVVRWTCASGAGDDGACRRRPRRARPSGSARTRTPCRADSDRGTAAPLAEAGSAAAGGSRNVRPPDAASATRSSRPSDPARTRSARAQVAKQR